MKLILRYLLLAILIVSVGFHPISAKHAEAFSLKKLGTAAGVGAVIGGAIGCVFTGGVGCAAGAVFGAKVGALTGAGIEAGKELLDGGDDPDAQAAAQACLSKNIDQLKDELKQKDAAFRIHRTDAYYEQKAQEGKESMCVALMNAEDEDQSPSESFLWKPKSDSDGKAVTLLPTSLRGLVVRTDVFRKEDGKKLDNGRFSGDEHNGMRPHYRFPKPGSSYGGPIQVIAAVAEGIWIWDIKDAAKRADGVKGKFATWAEVAAWEASQAAQNEQGVSPDGNGVSSCPAGQIDTNTDKSLRVMAMGDSNTEGISGSNNLAYRKAFKENMTALGYSVDMVGSKNNGDGFSDNQHEGYSGRGIAHLQAIASGTTLTTHNPNVILLLVGSNDMWVSLDNRTPISDTAANAKVAALGTLLDTIHTKLPNAKIVVAKPATPTVGSMAATRPLGIYKNGISTLASTRSYVSVVDFTGFGNDGVHYTTAGYNSIAETFANKVDEITRECTATTAPTAGYTTKALCESTTGFICEKSGDEWKATTTRIAEDEDGEELEVTCRVSDTTPGIDDEVDITLDVSGGTEPYEGKWSGDYRKADNFDKDAGDQTISFDKKGTYKIKVKITDDNGDTATDNCPTIKVTEEGEEDVIVTVTQPTQPITNTSPLTSAFYRDLTVGSSGSDVTALQQFLVSRGYLIMPAGTSYGYFGELTRKALASFQSANGIAPASGYFGSITRQFLTTGYVPSTLNSNYTSPVVLPQDNPTSNVVAPSASSCIDISSTIYYGEEGDNITKVQQFLVAQGYLAMPTGSTYGYYGKATVTALSKFMTSRGYAHNGAIMDSKILGELKSASCR